VKLAFGFQAVINVWYGIAASNQEHRFEMFINQSRFTISLAFCT